jgi:Ca2+-binding EF-hand superfamily protein
MSRTLARCFALSCLLIGPALWAEENDELFKRLDKNSDGQISKDEVDAEKARLFERLVRAGDKNNDGQLNREEFAAALKDRPTEPAQPAPGGDRPAPREIFQRFDKNGDGKISKDEAPERMQQNWERVDRNGDGFVTPDELAQAFQGLAGAPGKPDGKPDTKPENPQRKPDARPDAPVARPGILNFPPLLVALDTNRDGELSAEEIAGASKALASLDKNGDGKLTREELFPNMPANFQPGEGGGREILARLREADKDGDGKISREEAPERLRPLFERIDANGDGKLDETELRQMAERLQGRRPEPKP